MLVDANILLYAVDTDSRFHDGCSSWLTGALNSPRRVGIPWRSLWAFVRIATDHRVLAQPLTPSEAWSYVDQWLAAPSAWIPAPGRGHRDILAALIIDGDVRGPKVSDAVLAALCVEHGLTIVSADSDFARFPQVTWVDPTRPG